MTQVPDKDTIIDDIEFELMQGTGPRGDLGAALDAIRQEQNRLRNQYLGDRATPDGREVAGALLRLDEMLINLLQEALSRIMILQRQLRHTGRHAATGAASGPAVPIEDLHRFAGVASRAVPDEPVGTQIDLEIRPSRVPLVGGLLDRLRAGLHRVALFYVRRLAEAQGIVDAEQSAEIERLSRIVAAQGRHIAALQDQLTGPDRPSADGVAPGELKEET
jgi:hypothetical protein